MAKDELPRGQLSNIILSILTDTDMYGYEIIETIKEKTNGVLIVKQPSLYSCLRRMEEQNLISSYWRDSDIGGRRHYYSITGYGKKYAEKWQADLSIYNANSNKKSEEPQENPVLTKNETSIEKTEQKTETILQQTNLFSLSNETKDNQESTEQKTNSSFVQYDLFSSPTLISEPSDEVFDCIKKLRETADDENQISLAPEDKISILRNETYNNVEIKTTFVADNHNVNSTEVSQNDIKKEFFELSKRNKSFANVLKENPESVIKEPEVYATDNDASVLESLSTEVNLPNKELYDMSSIFTQKEEVKQEPTLNQNLKQTETNTLETEEMPTIFQSTTQYNDDELKEDSSAPFEFIDLNNLDFDTKDNVDVTETITTEETTEQNSSSKLFDLVEDPIIREDQPVSHTTVEPLKPTDDAVYITEKPSYSDFPKVKKIAPARFEQFTKYDSRIDKKVSDIYNKQYIKEQPIPEITQEQEFIEEKLEQSEQKYTPINDFDSLKQYYKNLNINFNLYKKEQNINQTNYINKNKLNMFTYISISALSIVLSIIMFCIFRDNQSAWNWLYLVLPIGISLGNIYFVARYITNKSSITPTITCFNYNWVYKLTLSIVSILVLFAINLLCGMDLENISSFITTFIYLSTMICIVPLSSLSNFIFIKSGAVKI